ncbi:MAG: hypothetical protein M1822_000629 [Bathelium mastoideum]|nr:MAG: hypothetical protein M1822_000629 [Bathelium mastoideum]
MELLASEKEGGATTIPIPKLLFWSIGICVLGPVIAASRRRFFLLREKLHFPSATATGVLLGVLFNDESISLRADNRQRYVHSASRSNHITQSISADSVETFGIAAEVRDDSEATQQEDTQRGSIRILVTAFAGSFAISFTTYFIPVLRSLPVFGSQAAKDWAWTFSMSPGYFGFGMIIKPSTNAHVFLGAILGWAILSPLAKLNGWASGPVQDWDSGSQGWIVWVGIGLAVGDSIIELSWMILEPMILRLPSYFPSRRNKDTNQEARAETVPLLTSRAILLIHKDNERQDLDHLDDPWPGNSLFTKSMAFYLLPAIFVLCAVAIVVVFDGNIPSVAIIAAFLLVPLACMIAIRSLGQVESANSLAISQSHAV